MTKIITGRVEVFANGESLLIKDGAKITGVHGPERAPVTGPGGIHGYNEVVSPSTCEFSITDRNDKLLSTLSDLTDATLIFGSANGGKQYIMKHAFCQANFEVTSGEGEVPVMFFGDAWDEQLS